MKYVRPNEGDVVLYVGAYKGGTTKYFADKVGPTEKLHSFEPVNANYDDLVRNLQVNNLKIELVTVNKCLCP